MTTRTLRVSAPGKAILMGEHAAVYGRPALVAAVDRRMHLVATPFAEVGLRLVLPQVGVDALSSWEALRAYGAARRDAWRSWHDAGAGDGFEKVLGEDPAHLVKVAVAESLIEIEEELGTLPRAFSDSGYRLEMVSDIPLGSGFGSSAAASVTVCRALLELAGVDAPADRLHRLSLEAERRQHGAPSGVDNATVIHGGVLWVSRDESGLVMTPVELRNRGLLSKLRIVHSGAPAEATGQVVAAVRRRRDLDPRAFERDLDAATEHTAELRRLLEAPSCDDAEVLTVLRGFGHWLEAQGAVPPAVRDLIRRVEAAGGAAKISGAGALSGQSAGSLLMFHPEPDKLDAAFCDPALQDTHLVPLDLRFGAPGIRIDPGQRPTEDRA